MIVSNPRSGSNTRVGFIGLVMVLAAYLLLRHTLFVTLTGIDIPESVTGVSDSIWLSTLIIALFLLAGTALVVSKRVHESIEFRLRGDRSIRAEIFVLLSAALLLLGLGKITFNEYTDETRDVRISNLVAEHGLDIFVDGRGLEAVTDSSIHDAHQWAQRLHPPGQYVPASVLRTEKRDLRFYRFLFLLPVVVAAVAATIAAGRDRRRQLFVLVSGTLLFSLTFFRNYTLIRFGNELIPFLAFSGFLGLMYHVYRSSNRNWSAFLALGFLAFAAAIFTKFSVLVAIVALIAALILAWFIVRERILVRLAAGALFIFIASAAVYLIAFDGTAMLEQHVQSYWGRILESLRLVSREELIEQGIKPEGRSPISSFLLSVPFSYGPIILISTVWSIVRIARRRVRPGTVDIVLLLFLSIGLVGVLLVNPRAQYTAPLLFGLVFFSTRHIMAEAGDAEIVKLSLVGYLFVVSELLFYILS